MNIDCTGGWILMSDTLDGVAVATESHFGQMITPATRRTHDDNIGEASKGSEGESCTPLDPMGP